MPERLFIRMLTGGDLQVEAPDPVEIRGRNARALLVLLALEAGQAVSRDRIAGYLWPDSDQQAARASLRMALMTLRRAFGHAGDNLIAATNDALALRVDSDDIDCLRFSRLAARADPDSRIAALALYRGNLLERLAGTSVAFDDLIRIERERLQALAIDAGHAILANPGGAPGSGLQIASKAILSADPTDEPAHRALMRTHLAAGDRAAALYQFELCRAALAELDAGIEPADETMALRDEIAAASAPASPPAAPGGPTPPPRPVDPTPLPIRTSARIVGTLVLALAVGGIALWFLWPPSPCPPQAGIPARLALYDPDPATAEAADRLRRDLRLALWRLPTVDLVTDRWLDASGSTPADAYRLQLRLESDGSTFRVTLFGCGGGETALMTGHYPIADSTLAADHIGQALDQHHR